MADHVVSIEIHNAVNGEQLASFELKTTDSLKELYLRLKDLVPPSGRAAMPLLLFEGQQLAAKYSSIGSAGILAPGPVALTLVWSVEPADLTKLGDVDISAEGYHCHDTHLVRVCSPDPGTFYMSWQRSYKRESGSWRAERERMRTLGPTPMGTNVHEDVLVDVVAEAAKPKDQRGLSVLTEPSGRREVDCSILGVFNGVLLVSVRRESGTVHTDQATMEIVEKVDGVSNRVFWRQEEDVRLMEAYGGQLQLTEMWVVHDKLIVAAERCCDDGTKPDILLRGDLDMEAGRISFSKWLDMDDTHIRCQSSFQPDIRMIGFDDSKKHIWFQVDRGRFSLVSVETFELQTVQCPNLELSVDTGERRLVRCVLDPVTEDLYFLVDLALTSFRSRWSTPSCVIYRLRAQFIDDGTASPVPCYDHSSYELICWEHLGIDGFSDSFCISLQRYDAASDALLIFDATGTLWSLSLRQARFQEARKHGWNSVEASESESSGYGVDHDVIPDWVFEALPVENQWEADGP
eukprot:s16_g25.t1